MFRTVLITLSLLTLTVPAFSMADESTVAMPGWLQAQFDARGIAVDASALRVVRTVTAGGESSTFEVSFSALPQDDPFGGYDVTPPTVPEVLAGDLTSHFMIQSDCSGYGAQEVAPGLTVIQESVWDFGFHVALGPLAGGLGVGTGSDPTAVDSNLFAVVNEDHGMTLAAGELSTTYDRIEIFGSCLIGLGTMTGTGVWVFN